jgi:hypothetical protein
MENSFGKSVVGEGDSNLELIMKLVVELKGGLQLDASQIAALFEAPSIMDVATSIVGGGEGSGTVVEL